MSNIIYNQVEICDNWYSGIEAYDYLILAGGSDKRSYEMLRNFREKNIQINQVILFSFKERIAVSDTLLERYNSIDDIGYPIIRIECSIFDPSEGLTILYKTISVELLKESNLAMDISAFPKPYFFSILNALDKYIKRPKIQIFYTEPLSYVFSKNNFSSYSSSSGPVKVEVVPSFIGLDKQNIKRVVVFILGFDGDLAKKVSIEIDTSDIILFNGFPSFSPKFKDISIIVNESLISSKNSLKYSEANNPFFLYNELQALKNELENNNHNVGEEIEINIVPLGAKPMALGACMFAIHNSDVRVIYPIPEKYHDVTTSETLRSWFYEIPLVN